MCRVLVLLLLLVGSSYAATHVNISIAQHPADVKYVEGSAPAELKAGPVEHDFSYHDETRSARLRQSESASQQQEHQQVVGQQVTLQQQLQLPQQQLHQQQQARVQLQSSPAPQMGVVSSNARAHMRHRGSHRRVNSQFRQRTPQDKQNQEFERYIQSYHSGPTVETVFESSSPAGGRQQSSAATSASSSSSSSDAAPQRVVAIGNTRAKQMPQFERQIALPQQREYAAPSANVVQDVKPIYENTAQSAPAQAGPTVTTSSSSSTTSSSSSTVTSNTPSVSTHQSGGFDAGTSYNKPSYDYSDTQDFQDQYPPSVDAAGHGGFDDYSDQGNLYDEPVQAPGYLPPARPLVTKTIQIVQPALKAKKYEVRHPAIQKEFYDIEERVVIKPAGTLVVELDHPVAKIPRGETLLPLGHPHPAVASAYNTQSGVTQSQQSNNVYSNNQQSQAQPSYASKPQAVTTVGSSVTTMPSYDQTPKDNFVEAKLRQPYTAREDERSQRDRELLLATDGNGQPALINTKHLSPKQLIRPDSVDAQRSMPSYVSREPEQRNYAYANPNPTSTAQFQENFNEQPEDYFTGEYFDSNARVEPQDAKPARIQQAVEPESHRTHIIKHEHNIHLPPAQHNIYLSRSTQLPESRLVKAEEEETPARVSEVRPYLQRHHAGVVVYAKPAVRPAGQLRRAQNSYNYRQPELPARYRAPAERVEYNAPYTHMRYEPAESSARYSEPQQSSRLVEERQEAKLPAKSTPQAHIHIQVPHSSESHKPIVVSSTISPPLSEENKLNTLPDREVENVSEARGHLAAKPDCDQVDAAPARYVQESNFYRHLRPVSDARSSSRQQYFQRLVEAPTTQATHSSANVENVKPENIDVSLQSAAGHMTPNSRVIAATPAPTGAAASSETFHKRRIVVNHPFQTVREVVEHEPITNYHQIQVNEPAMPAVYHQQPASYYQPPTHGNLVYHPSSVADHAHVYG